MTKQLILMDGEPQQQRRSVSRIDERTKEVGRLGLASARAALAEANRRSAARDSARKAQRDNELADRVKAARRLSLATAPDVSDENGPPVKAASKKASTVRHHHDAA